MLELACETYTSILRGSIEEMEMAASGWVGWEKTRQREQHNVCLTNWQMVPAAACTFPPTLYTHTHTPHPSSLGQFSQAGKKVKTAPMIVRVKQCENWVSYDVSGSFDRQPVSSGWTRQSGRGAYCSSICRRIAMRPLDWTSRGASRPAQVQVGGGGGLKH